MNNWLTSAYQTGVPFIDIIGKQFNIIKTSNQRRINETNIRVDNLLRELNPVLIDISNPKKAQELRIKLMKELTDNEGNLISQYNVADVYNRLRYIKNKINVVLQKEFIDNARDLSGDEYRKIIKTIHKYISSFNNEESELVELTEKELQELENVMKTKTIIEQISYLNHNNLIEFDNLNVGDKVTHKSYYRIKFKVETKEYIELKKHPERFKFLNGLKEIIKEAILEYNENFILTRGVDCIFPYVEISNIKVSETFQIPNVTEEDTYIDMLGNIKYIYKMKTLQVPQHYNKFSIKNDIPLTKALNEFKEWYDNKKIKKIQIDSMPETLEDINTFNLETEKANVEFAKDSRSYDISEVIDRFINEVYNNKSLIDFANDWTLSNYLLREHNAPELIPFAYNQSLRQLVTNHSTNKIKNDIDRASRVLLKYSSITYMWFNVTAGVKNVLKGVTDMIALTPMFKNGTVGGITSTREIKDGISAVLKEGLGTWIKELNYHGSSTFTGALIKDFESVYQDIKDVNITTSASNTLTKILAHLDTYGYLPNSSGEFIMQFAMLIACMNSHRVLGNQIVNLNDFVSQNEEAELLEVLTEEQKSHYYRFKEKEINRRKAKEANQKSRFKRGDDFIDYAGMFIRNRTLSHLSGKQYDKLKQVRKGWIKSRRELFNKLPTLRDCLELKDGHISIKEGSGINEISLNMFKDRVKGINQSLHGIYNNIDRSKLQDTVRGELIMQYRKWLVPNYIRLCGRRFNMITYNETLRAYETPIMRPFLNWFKQGYDIFKHAHPNDRIGLNSAEGITSLGRIIALQVKQIATLSHYYLSLSMQERIAAQQFIKYSGFFFTSLILVLALAGLKDRDKDLKDIYIYNLLLYELSGYNKELLAMLPVFGWISEIDQISSTPFAGWNVLKNTYKLGAETLNYLSAPFGEMDRYKSGMYKGMTKWQVAVMKSTPLYYQIYKTLNINNSVDYIVSLNRTIF
jgi:hypothetical protein